MGNVGSEAVREIMGQVQITSTAHCLPPRPHHPPPHHRTSINTSPHPPSISHFRDIRQTSPHRTTAIPCEGVPLALKKYHRYQHVAKAPGMDGVRVEMLKEGDVTVLEWLVRLFNICYMLSVVPVDWVIACMVPLYKGKGDMYDSSNFRDISLLSVVGKVYGRVLINRIRDKTENVIAEVQGCFRRGRGCTDQIFIKADMREVFRKG